MKKLMIVVAMAAVAAVAVWNFNQSSQVVSPSSDLTLENLEAIAQGRGHFPACQKGESDANKPPVEIPFCIGNKCEDSKQIPKGLNVNYCSQDPYPL